MNINSTNAISPIDGRYSNQTKHLSEFFSEKALIKYRLKVEVEYFIKLTLTGIDQLKNWNLKNKTCMNHKNYLQHLRFLYFL